MKKISKIILGGVLFLGCALTLSGCTKSGISGTYEQSITTAPTTNQQFSKKYAPRVIYHITSHNIYAQPLQPHFKKISKEDLTLYKQHIKQRIKDLKKSNGNTNSAQGQQQTQTQNQAQAQSQNQTQQNQGQSQNNTQNEIPSQSDINKHINIVKKYSKRTMRDNQDFKIKNVKKHGNVYTFKGRDYIHLFGVNKKDKSTTMSKKSKMTIIKIKKTKYGIKLLKTQGKLSIGRYFKNASTNNVKKLLKQNYIKPSQDGY